MNNDMKEKLEEVIQQYKNRGYKVLPKSIGHYKETARVICEEEGVNFFIDDESLSDLRYRWVRNDVCLFIPFYDWLLQEEI